MILRCGMAGCKSEFQDKEHGKDMRIHNETNNGARCTICLNEKQISSHLPRFGVVDER